MKNFSKYFLMGTVALSGMTAFTACSSENEPSAEVNPTFNGSTVKAQFALNLPYAATGTRMTENATQLKDHFRGMSSMTLLPFAETTVDGVQTSTSAMLLGTNDNAFDKDGDGQGRYVYRDIEIPVGTQSFVFYGKATGTPANTDVVDDCFKYGYLTETPISAKDKVSLSDVKFALKQINSNLNLATAVGTGDKSYNKVLAALDKVTGTKVGAIAWNNIGTPADMKLDHAKKLWEAFSKLKAGSSASVKVALERLAESTGVEALADGVDATKDGAGLLALLHKNADEAAASLNNVSFPNDIHIPDGAVALKYTDSKEWKYQSSVTMKEDNKIAYANITYPASLNYFVKTAAMANDNAATTLGSTASFWPKQDDWAKYDAENSNTTDPWTSLSDWSQGVKNSTRTIALKEAIQYGVANLKLTINTKTDNLDDNATVTGGQVADQNIDVTGNKLKMTGVLVGGQPSEVAWNYEPTSGATFDRTVYDNKMNKSADDVNTTGIDVPVNSPSVANYTLVLDNKNNTTGGSQADVVYVTVELVNGTDVDFYGVDGMVPKGGKFYLVGKLDMNKAGLDKKGLDHIFVQDHTTVANFTIKDLKNAYNNIPDLRSTSVSVGLAVNLTWENGIEFNVEI